MDSSGKGTGRIIKAGCVYNGQALFETMEGQGSIKTDNGIVSVGTFKNGVYDNKKSGKKNAVRGGRRNQGQKQQKKVNETLRDGIQVPNVTDDIPVPNVTDKDFTAELTNSRIEDIMTQWSESLFNECQALAEELRQKMK